MNKNEENNRVTSKILPLFLFIVGIIGTVYLLTFGLIFFLMDVTANLYDYLIILALPLISIITSFLLKKRRSFHIIILIIFYCLAFVLYSRNKNNSVGDELTSTCIDHINEDIRDIYFPKNSRLPENIEEVTYYYNNDCLDLIDSSTIYYKKINESSFEICGSFNTKNSNYSEFSKHDKGNFCFFEKI